MIEEEKANCTISDSRSASASASAAALSSPHVPPGFLPKVCTTTTTAAAAAGLSRNQNPIYPIYDANVLHANIGTSDSCSKEEPPRHSPRIRSQRQLIYVPAAPTARKPETGLRRRRGRPRKSESMFRLAHLEIEKGNTNQIIYTPSRRLQEVPGHVICHETPQNFGCNNLVSEGIDPEILQHVANSLQYMAESHTALDDANVISRSSDINKDLVHILEAITIKHGDITQNCSLESDCMKTLVLLGICKVVQDLQRKQLKDLDISCLDSYYSAVRDAENMKVNVQWLRSRLDEIKDAIKISDEAKGLINERDRRVKYIDGKKTELMLRKDDLERLKYEVQDIEKHLAQEVVMVDELNKKFDNRISKISQFQHAYLMNGLI